MKKVSAFMLALLFPGVALAVSIGDILATVEQLLSQVVGLLIAIATIVFMWGIIKYVGAGGDEEKVREGRNLMIFGIIGLAVMISVWGLVKLLTSTFGFTADPIPHIDSPGAA